MGYFKSSVKAGSFVLLLCLVLVGCRSGHPVHNVDNASVPQTLDKVSDKQGMERMRKAIKEAGVELGWIIEDTSLGVAIGTLNIRKHMARVQINYTATTYSIVYKDSLNLNYDPTNNTIHNQYNNWIRNLEQGIKTRMASY